MHGSIDRLAENTGRCLEVAGSGGLTDICYACIFYHILTMRRYPLILLRGEWHCESKVSCPRTQQEFLPRNPWLNVLIMSHLTFTYGVFSREGNEESTSPCPLFVPVPGSTGSLHHSCCIAACTLLPTGRDPNVLVLLFVLL